MKGGRGLKGVVETKKSSVKTYGERRTRRRKCGQDDKTPVVIWRQRRENWGRGEKDEENDDRCAPKKVVAMATVSEGRGVTRPPTSDELSRRETEIHEGEVDRRRQRVLAMLKTAGGQRMVQQMFAARDELKNELASLAQRLKRIDGHIETMLQQAASTS